MGDCTEVWKEVDGFCGYQVSNTGNVRNTRTGLILRPRPEGKGDKYLGVALYSGSKKSRKDVRVHRLVAAAFIDSVPDGKQVNHKNGDTRDNRADNLEYVTCRENIIHAHANGLSADFRGSKSPLAILNEGVVAEIKAMLGTKTQQHIAEMFGVSRPTISAIASGRNWSHVRD